MPKNTPVIQELTEQEKNQSSVAVRVGGAAAQNTMRNIGLIVGREYKNRLSQRSFIISTIVILVLVLIGACVPTVFQYFAAKTSSQTKLAVVNNAGAVGGMSSTTLPGYIGTQLNGNAQATAASVSGQSNSGQPRFAVTTGDDSTGLQQKVRNGSLDMLLIIDRAADRSLHFTYYTSSADDSNLPQVQTVAGQLSFLDRAHNLGLTSAQTSSLFTQPAFTVVNTKQNQDTRSTADIVAGYIIAYAGIILILMSVFLYGIGVAMGVAEEKGSRIMEILVNAATPVQLLAGKIIGIGAAGLTQMASIVVVGILAILLQTPLQHALLGTSNSGLSINITGTSITLLVLLLVYFILGFTLYATLFAAMGALVKRQDEVQNTIQPVTWLFMIGYIVSFIGISSPNATWIRIISYIPFWTPTTMLMRIDTGSVAPWEIALTIGLMLVAIFICAVISARIYRFGILMYGQRPGLGQLIKVVSSK